MKKNLSYLLVSALMIFTSISCSKDGKENPTPGQAEFSFTLSDLKSALKSAKADSVTNVSAIVLTIEDLSGKVLYNNEKVELYNMNGYYISKPLSLVPGGYKLSKFLVVDASNTVVYATPTEGSTKAYLVNDPLPILFSVTKDNVTKVVPEVISVKNSTPEDFGYATFSFTEVATFDFLIGVFVYNESVQNFEMTTAHLSVAADSGWVYEKEVAAATDTITVKDNQIKYILTVTKDGYETWTDTLNADELKLQYSSEDNGPLIVILSNGQIVDGSPCPGTPTVTDADGNVYPTVLIGTQCWMAKNLHVGTMINSSLISSNNGTTEKYCYDNDSVNCNIYGGLYHWDEMMSYQIADTIYPIGASIEINTDNPFTKKTRGICPLGWHLPSFDEFVVFSKSPNKTNFNFKLGGQISGQSFYYKNIREIFWNTSALDPSDTRAYGQMLDGTTDPQAGNSTWIYKVQYSQMGSPVRCLKNN